MCWKTSSTPPSKSLMKTLQLPPSNLRNFIDYPLEISHENAPTTPLELTKLDRLPPSKSLMKTLQLPPSNLRNFIDYPPRNSPQTCVPPPPPRAWRLDRTLPNMDRWTFAPAYSIVAQSYVSMAYTPPAQMSGLAPIICLAWYKI